MKEHLQTLACSATDATDWPNLLAELTAGLIEAFDVDWAAILSADENPPILVVTERKDIANDFHQEVKAHIANVYA